jgi:hypothetical protein
MMYTLAAGDRWAILTRRACPHCGSVETARAHRRTLLDEALAAMRIFPYRCSRCAVRFRATSWLRSLGEKPWSADPRIAVIGRRWTNSASAWPVALLSTAIIALLGASAAVLLLILNQFGLRILAI